jgi:hypothetical protein
VSIIQPTLADPLAPEDAWKQAADRVTPIGEYLGAKALGGLEAIRPVEAFGLARLPSRYAADEYGLMPPGPPPPDLLTKEQFDASPHARPGLEWEEGETEARAAARAAVHDRQAYRDSLVARSDAGPLGQVGGFAIGLGTAALDPTNYIPLIGAASKAAMAARFGRIGGALLMHGTEAAANTALFEPLAAASAQAQGRGYGWEEAGADVLMNALGGAVLGTAVGEGARALGFGHGERAATEATVPDAGNVGAGEAIISRVQDVGAGVVPRRPGTPPLRVDDLMRRADGANLALDQIDRGEPVDVGKLLANDPAMRRPVAPAPPDRAEGVAITSAGRRVPVAYEVVEARDLIASHTDDMRPNPDFPAALQPRDRTRAASGSQVAAMAGSLEPALLGRSATASEGAPIVGPDGVVESGNARVLAIRKAYREGLAGSTAYRDELARQGYAVAGMEAPVLVRRRTGEMAPAERAAFAREANVSGVAAMGTTERALADAKGMKVPDLLLVQSGDMHAAANRPFVRAFMGRLSEGERGGLLTASGELSKAGGDRLRSALLAKAFGDPELVTRLAEEPESKLGGLGRALGEIAPEWAAMRVEIAVGHIAPEGEGTAALREALQSIVHSRDTGEALHAPLLQGDMMGGGLSRDAAAFLRSFLVFDQEGGSKLASGKRIAEVLERYVAGARKQTPGRDMFGALPATPAEILEGRRAPMSTATAAPEAPHPSVGEAAPRVGKAADELATFKEDAKLEGYEQPLPGHEPKPEPGSADAARAERATPAIPPTAKEQAIASAALPPELQEVEAMRREGTLTPADEATLAAGEAEGQQAEGYATAYETLLNCVLRNA